MKLSHKIYVLLACVVLLLWPVWEFGKVFFDWEYNNPVEYFRVREEVKAHMEEKHPNQKYYIIGTDYHGYMNGYEFAISIPEDELSFNVELFYRSGGILHCCHPNHRYNFAVSPYPLEDIQP